MWLGWGFDNTRENKPYLISRMLLKSPNEALLAGGKKTNGWDNGYSLTAHFGNMRQLPSGDVSHADRVIPGAHVTLDKESNWQVRLSSSVSLNQAGLHFKTCGPASMSDCIRCGNEQKWAIQVDADMDKGAREVYDWKGEGQVDFCLLRLRTQEYHEILGQAKEEFEEFLDCDKGVQKVQADINTVEFKRQNNISKELGRAVEDGFLTESEDEENLEIVKVTGEIEAMDTSQDS